MDLALLSVRNTTPAEHTSPSQCVFGRVLRNDLPQHTDTLDRFTPRRGTVVPFVHHKLKQKNAYDKHACAPLPDLPPGSYFYVKPPPYSSTLAWIQRNVVDPASPSMLPQWYWQQTKSRLLPMGTNTTMPGSTNAHNCFLINSVISACNQHQCQLWLMKLHQLRSLLRSVLLHHPAYTTSEIPCYFNAQFA